MTYHQLNPLTNPNLCDCTVMAQFQSDASTYFWLGAAIALAGCLAARGVLKIFNHYKALKPYKDYEKEKNNNSGFD